MEVVGAWYIYNNILLLSIGNAARCSYLHRWLCHWYSSSMHRHSISCHWILCKCKCFTFVPADPLGVKVLCAWVDVNVHMHWCQCVVIYQSILKCYWSLNVEVYLHHSWFIAKVMWGVDDSKWLNLLHLYDSVASKFGIEVLATCWTFLGCGVPDSFWASFSLIHSNYCIYRELYIL